MSEINEQFKFKFCGVCEKTLDNSQFTKSNAHCDSCHKIKQIEYRENHKRYMRENPEYYPHQRTKSICKLLKEHSTNLKNDPQHLTTTFIKNIINTGVDHCPEIE